jgi:UDP-galactopyranose mutase
MLADVEGAQRPVAIVGAGWAGATAARTLHDVGIPVEVFESAPVVGGHARVEVLEGVVYEPNGPHIFHTSDEEVASLVTRFGMGRPFQHRVLTEVFEHDDDELGRLLAWPLQVDELEQLRSWPQVRDELARRPAQPAGASFEEHVISLMGETLYRLFIEGYTRKQWGAEPSSLSADLAPRRVELRDDGHRGLFRDRYEWFPPDGVNGVIAAMLDGIPLTCGQALHVDDLHDADRRWSAVVVTAPCDAFTGAEPLPWRGIHMQSRFEPTDGLDGTVTPAYQINRPSMRWACTRTIETKHASGQRVHGSVVSEEHPEAGLRHYPVPSLDGAGVRRNQELQRHIAEQVPVPVAFCGRLAEYRYLDQDETIRSALDTTLQLLSDLS